MLCEYDDSYNDLKRNLVELFDIIYIIQVHPQNVTFIFVFKSHLMFATDIHQRFLTF